MDETKPTPSASSIISFHFDRSLGLLRWELVFHPFLTTFIELCPFPGDGQQTRLIINNQSSEEASLSFFFLSSFFCFFFGDSSS